MGQLYNDEQGVLNLETYIQFMDPNSPFLCDWRQSWKDFLEKKNRFDLFLKVK